jgi:hypothetical protein
MEGRGIWIGRLGRERWKDRWEGKGDGRRIG